MQKRYSHHYFSRGMLLQMFIVLAIIVVVIIWQREFLFRVYVLNQTTALGWVINGGILALFATGMLRIVNLFSYYGREEDANAQFGRNLSEDAEPTHNIPLDAIISRRYNTLLDLHAQRAVINHSALAATLVAQEASKLSYPKFINNILILTGVFGTIVSLSIALLGAYGVVEGSTGSSGLALVIHGMSTALSTTMTAILCFLIFSYFFLRLADAQTNLISHVEHITATQLITRFQVEIDSAIGEFAHFIHTAKVLLQRMEQVEESHANSAAHLKDLMQDFYVELQHSNDKTEEMVTLLREGFRLPEEE